MPRDNIRAARKDFNHNQAPGQVCGGATEGWPKGREEWERASQIARMGTDKIEGREAHGEMNFEPQPRILLGCG
jgi:hypothetical protein